MGGWSGKCAYCGQWHLQPAALGAHKRSAHNVGAHKRSAHNVGGHRGGQPDRQDMTVPWEGRMRSALGDEL